VGSKTKARGEYCSRGAGDSNKELIKAKEKAKVLPEPVRPRPRTSRPCKESGSVAAWIGKAVMMPSSAKRSTSASGTPKSAKLGWEFVEAGETRVLEACVDTVVLSDVLGGHLPNPLT
jgi:hypothetical protein